MVSPNRGEEQEQGSFYDNLTFDEMHNQLENVGKPLNAMNLDELRNAISVEEGQLVQNPSSSSSSSSASFFLGNFNLNGCLSKKNIDGVWKDINVSQEHANGVDSQLIQQQLGETTLEDFLVRAGVINIGNQNGGLNPQQALPIDPMVVVSQQTDWLQFQMAAVQQQQQQQPVTLLDSSFHVSEAVYENPVLNVGYAENQLGMNMPVPSMSATSSESQAAAEKKRRYSDEMMEKTIERRKKRMIKNRESAARSRARKQAYTNKLELEVSLSRKTNSWLKKQKEVEMLLSCDLTPVPRYQLRRTSSATF